MLWITPAVQRTRPHQIDVQSINKTRRLEKVAKVLPYLVREIELLLLYAIAWQALTLGSGVAIRKALVLPDPHEVPASLLVPGALYDATIVLPGLIAALCGEGSEGEGSGYSETNIQAHCTLRSIVEKGILLPPTNSWPTFLGSILVTALIKLMCCPRNGTSSWYICNWCLTHPG